MARRKRGLWYSADHITAYSEYSLTQGSKRWQRRLVYWELPRHLLALNTDTVELLLQDEQALRIKPISFKTSDFEVVDFQYDVEFKR